MPEIRKSILVGRLKPGAKIIESRLAATLGVSRTPLREALLHLEREGLVRSDLRRGFTVEPLSAREVRETYPLLATLECHAVRTSAPFLPPLLPALERMNAQFRRARGAQQALELDTHWHDALISPSNNSRLAGLIASLRRCIRRYELIYMSDTALLPTSAAQHDAILGALRKDDIEAALKAIEANYILECTLSCARWAKNSHAGRPELLAADSATGMPYRDFLRDSMMAVSSDSRRAFTMLLNSFN